MSINLEPLAKAGSKGLDAVVEHIDPKAIAEKLDPRPLADKIEKIDLSPLIERLDKVDARAAAVRLDPRPIVEKLDPSAKLAALGPRVKRIPPPKKRRGRLATIAVVVLVGTGAVAFWAARKRRASGPPLGRDTATGTDPQAKYDRAGYEDKSLGQAVNSDMNLADKLVAEEHGDLGRAEQRFQQESAGAPALRRQASGG